MLSKLLVLHVVLATYERPPEITGWNTSSKEHELLDTMSEGVSKTMTLMHAKSEEPWLATRAWSGNSHIGNRPAQNAYYYELAKKLRPKVICEIGLNQCRNQVEFLSSAT